MKLKLVSRQSRVPTRREVFLHGLAEKMKELDYEAKRRGLQGWRYKQKARKAPAKIAKAATESVAEQGA